MAFEWPSMFKDSLNPWTYGAHRGVKRLDNFQAGKTGYTTGISNLDPFLRFVPGELSVIAARSATGKTAIGMQILHNIREQMRERGATGGVCIFSAEMDVETLVMREACALERAPLWKLQDGSASEYEYKRVRDRMLSLAQDFQMLVDDSSTPTLDHMIRQLTIQQDEVGPVEVVMVDYTELVGEAGMNEGQRVALISRGLKAIANEFACPVIALSQLNRDIETRENKHPTMRDLMHGGEREPDRIVVLVRPWLYDKDADQRLTDVTSVKNRNGQVGSTQLGFDGDTMRFFNLERIELNE